MTQTYTRYYVPGTQAPATTVAPTTIAPSTGTTVIQPGTTYPTYYYPSRRMARRFGYSSMYVAPTYSGTATTSYYTPAYTTSPAPTYYAPVQRRGLFGRIFGRRLFQSYSPAPTGYTYVTGPMTY
jgi:hypothetical protein